MKDKTKVEANKGLYPLQDLSDFLNNVFDHISDPTMVINLNYNVIFANKAAKKTFHSRDPVAEHLNCYQAIHRLDRPCTVVCQDVYSCPIKEVIYTRRPSRVIHPIRNLLNNDIFMEIISSPIFGARGDVVQVVKSFRDVTEGRKETENLKKLVLDFQVNLAATKRLNGLLPICVSCKRIRNDAGRWKNLEVYISSHSDATFSHSLCPECNKEVNPGIKSL